MRLMIILFIIFMIGCTGFHDIAIQKEIQKGTIHIGSSKSDVANVISAPSKFCVKTKIRTDGTYEMWDYASNLCGINFIQSFILIFKDDSLIEIRNVSSILDTQF